MPIRGLTDNAAFGAGLPRIASLHKGEPQRENGNGKQVVGRDLDHFRIAFHPPYEHLEPLWTELYGEKPTAFEPVYLAGETVDNAFDNWHEEWTATSLLHRCDSETQVRHYTNGSYSDQPIPCAAPQCKCRPVGRLNLILPEFIEAAGVLGYITCTTSSVYDIMSIYRYLADIQRMYGRLTGVPFTFGRAPRKVSVPGKDGKRMNTTKSLLYITVMQDFTRTSLLPALAGQQPPAAAPALAAGHALADDYDVVDTSVGSWFDDQAARAKYTDWLMGEGLDVALAQALVEDHPSTFRDGRAACQAVVAQIEAAKANGKKPMDVALDRMFRAHLVLEFANYNHFANWWSAHATKIRVEPHLELPYLVAEVRRLLADGVGEELAAEFAEE